MSACAWLNPTHSTPSSPPTIPLQPKPKIAGLTGSVGCGCVRSSAGQRC